ncbi:MAG: methyltransferase, partial [Bacteroidales bacterium]|nr:methyltransferase [Bacteroidales bacterium]
EPKHNDPYTAGIIALNDIVQNDPTVENVIVPVRDGLTIVRKL